eukprot:TRINITY_DN5664_c0_g1_i1.p1 TRINITY_DN5664_c0_g1~~TRINITY_DN5664_c0_g1_i1.p1  ORF type:complete len:571 (-),score=170.74 TRINITY_DN5664_c0_g1_i1:84-1796(-)
MLNAWRRSLSSSARPAVLSTHTVVKVLPVERPPRLTAADKLVKHNETVRSSAPTLYAYDPDTTVSKFIFDSEGNVERVCPADGSKRDKDDNARVEDGYLQEEPEEPAINSRWARSSVNQTKQTIAGGQRKRTVKFMDRIIAEARGGNGGKGCVAFGIPSRLKAKNSHRQKLGPPDGGNGGNGGDVVIKAASSVHTLDMNSFAWSGSNGTNGSGRKSHGKHGSNLVIHVPCGTVVRVTPRAETGFQHYFNEISFDTFFKDAESVKLRFQSKTGQSVSAQDKQEAKKIKKEEEEQEAKLREHEEDGTQTFPSMTKEYDLLKENDFVIVAQGGLGGIGNSVRKSIPHGTKERAIPGTRGDVVKVELELKTIADVGLVGMPNAGKSSLTTAISSASPKVAAYPFTTLMPYIGVVRLTDKKGLHKSIREDHEQKFTVADIPGIIEGAAGGRGLGLRFLRHVERTKILLYVIDIVGSEGRDPVEDFMTLAQEVGQYKSRNLQVLSQKPAMIFANKMDLNERIALENARRLAEMTDLPVYLGSAKDGSELGHLVRDLYNIINIGINDTNDEDVHLTA